MAVVVDQNGLIIEESSTGSGTGNYESFLRLASTDAESGYNTEENGQLDNKDGIWTHDLFIGNLVIVDGYAEIRLDLNEIQSGTKDQITLEDLQLFVGDPAGADFYPGFDGRTPAFDLAGSVLLDDTNHGSGTDDYVIRIPESMLSGGDYLTLYARFSGSDDGFEEFRALSTEFVPTPDIGILKETNDRDDECNNIIVGDPVTWTYTVENNGNITLTNVVVKDDAGTAGDTSDDITATFVGGDTDSDGKLDTNETWTFTASAPAGAVAGEYANVATVTADWAFAGDGSSGTVSSFEEDCYFGADPSIDIIKKTNGTDDLCPVVHVGDTITWTYFVENTGNVALENIVLSDDAGSDGVPGDDITPTEVLSGLYNAGDLNTDGIFDPGEIWQYSATGLAIDGHYDNIAYVTADFTDDFDHKVTVDAHEDDCYVGVEGPGVRTPGFWSNPLNGGQFWNGSIHDEKHAGEDCFPFGELTRTDFNQDGIIDDNDGQHYIFQGTTKGLLIGDWDMNGVQNGTEDTLFVSLDAAKLLINASQKEQQDGRWVVGRDVVATWLNYLAGNPIGDIDGDANYDPKEAIRDAIDYLQVYGDNTNHDGILATANGKSILWEGAASVVKQGTANWANIGSPIHGALDEYNNTGAIDGIGYAHTCDTDQFVALMSGFSVHGDLFVM